MRARIRRLLRAVQPQLDVLEEGERLRGPLSTFVQCERERAAAGGDGNTKPGVRTDWQKRRKKKREADYMQGAYRLEELVL